MYKVVLDNKFGSLVSQIMVDMRSFSISKIPSFMHYMVRYGLPETEEAFEWLKDKIVDEFYGDFEVEWESEEHYNNFKEMTFAKYMHVVHRACGAAVCEAGNVLKNYDRLGGSLRNFL